MIDRTFWREKRVFLTGHTGFKGSWLSLWLAHLGAEVRGYSLAPTTNPSLFEEIKIGSIIDSTIGDVRDHDSLQKSMVEFDPDILIHMAAQPLVRLSYDAPIETYEVNVIGTAKVLETARDCPNLKAIVNITTDKCYENDGRSDDYKESDPMGGYDPYSSSKGCAELVASSYRRSFLKGKGVGLASVRAGNVIGGGDWAQDRIVPDCMKAWADNQVVEIRSPHATRPWQHVIEPLSGYLTLAKDLAKDSKNHGQAYNFGPAADQNHSVSSLINEMSKNWSQVRWNDVSNDEHVHEAGLLKLNCDKAMFDLDWKPTLQFEETVKMTVEWYRKFYQNPNDSMYEYTINQIDAYSSLAKLRKISWASDD